MQQTYLLSDAMRVWDNEAEEATHWTASRPTSLYIHIPFCGHKCGYCNFAVTAGRDYMIEEYMQALELELLAIPQGQLLKTIFSRRRHAHSPIAAIARQVSKSIAVALRN